MKYFLEVTDVHLNESSMRVKVLFIMPLNPLDASMTSEKAVLLTSSPGMKKGSEEAILSSPGAEAMPVILKGSNLLPLSK